MAYVKFHDPWGSGSCCGPANPGPDTPITKGALDHIEAGIFNAATVADSAQTDATQALSDAAAAQTTANTANTNAAAANTNANTRVLRAGDTMTGPLTIGNATPTNINFQSVTSGDTQARMAVLANGTIVWGDGATPTDVDLFRSSAGVLRTGSQFSINNVGLATDAELRLSRDVGHLANIRMRTGTLDRWGIQASNAAESGGNGGSDLNFQRFDDAGVLIGNVMNMTRSTGVVMITTPGVGSGAVVSIDGTQPLTNKTYAGFGATATTINMTQRVTGDTAVRWTLDASGAMSWSPGAGAQDTFLKRTAGGVLQGTDTQFQSTRATTLLIAHSALVNGDTNNRWQVLAGGSVQFGPGNAAVDFTFARTGVNTASVSGVLQYIGGSGTGGFSTFVTADTVARVAILNTGILFGPGNAAGDTSLTRVNVGVLGTQGLQASGAVSAAGGFASTRAAATVTYASQVTADTNFRWQVTSSGVMAFGPGNAAVDVTFTRSGTAELTMVGALRLNGNVGFYNTAPVAKPTVTGSRGANAALASLLTALAGQGLLTDSSTV